MEKKEKGFAGSINFFLIVTKCDFFIIDVNEIQNKKNER